MTGRLRRNSTHGPSGTAINAPTASPAAERNETCAVVLCNTRTAMSGKASSASHVPTVLVA
jgi:hypothetical protein